MTAQTSLADALLAIYTILSFPVLYIIARHGFKGGAILGWGYLFVFCTLKIVGSAMQLSNPASSGASIVSSIGLSPLLLATAGVLHEARSYRDGVPNKGSNPRRKQDTVFVLLFHIMIMSGVALLAVGASKLIDAETNPTSGSGDSTQTAYAMGSAGAGILLAAWLVLILGAYLSCIAMPNTLASEEPAVGGSRILQLGVVKALPFLGVRVATSFVSFVAKQTQKLSPAGGNIGLVVGLETVQELIVTLVLVAAGFATRNIAVAEVSHRRNIHV